MSTAETAQETAVGSPVVGTAIREARLKAEMTQDDLAGALGVTQTCVSYWENARRDLGVTDLLRVAAAINVPVVSLLGAEYVDAPEHEPEPPLPEGVYCRVKIKGYQQYDGWLTEGTFLGVPYGILRDEQGREIARFPPDSVHLITPLLPGLKPREPEAITDGNRWGAGSRPDEDDLNDYDDFEGPA